MKYKVDGLQYRIDRIIASVTSVIPPEKIEIIYQDLQAGEIRLALEGICDSFLDIDIPVDSSVLKEIKECANIMNMDDEIYRNLRSKP